jgi:hypothetical protein
MPLLRRDDEMRDDASSRIDDHTANLAAGTIGAERLPSERELRLCHCCLLSRPGGPVTSPPRRQTETARLADVLPVSYRMPAHTHCNPAVCWRSLRTGPEAAQQHE